ncbi:hypothetical protein Adt_21172 [Abeliophyllum distichum]|uniref:Uncharacterized protein n=1 Tax=Abeliophyllum distichum TaxID=126358 RepID=A0ABD1SYL4_9LAMI
MELSRDNGVLESKDECDNDMLLELKDDGVVYLVDDEALIVRHVVQKEGVFSLLNARDDSRSNPFEEGGDDAIQDYIERILESSKRLEEQNKHETELEVKNADGQKLAQDNHKNQPFDRMEILSCDHNIGLSQAKRNALKPCDRMA